MSLPGSTNSLLFDLSPKYHHNKNTSLLKQRIYFWYKEYPVTSSTSFSNLKPVCTWSRARVSLCSLALSYLYISTPVLFWQPRGEKSRPKKKKKRKRNHRKLERVPACVPNGGFGGRLDHWLLLLWRPRPSPLAGHEQNRDASVLCFDDGHSWFTSRSPGGVSSKNTTENIL